MSPVNRVSFLAKPSPTVELLRGPYDRNHTHMRRQEIQAYEIFCPKTTLAPGKKMTPLDLNKLHKKGRIRIMIKINGSCFT